MTDQLKKVKSLAPSLNRAMLLLALSWFLVAFGQPARFGWIGIVSSVGGFALFWQALNSFSRFISVDGVATSSVKKRFAIAWGWYALVQCVQLSWMTSIEFQGYYIIGVYFGLCILLGVQFGAVSLLATSRFELSWMRILAIASLWTLFEWSRFFFICGFSWNPVGLAMTSTVWGAQISSLWGILGLSFWVFFTNLSVLKLWNELQDFVWKREKKRVAAVITVLLLVVSPYLFGLLYIRWQENKKSDQESSPLMVALVQTGLLPSEKVPIQGQLKTFIPPFDQWKRIFGMLEVISLRALSVNRGTHYDLIVLPEAVVPYRADLCTYPYERTVNLFKEFFGQEITSKLPPLGTSLTELRHVNGASGWYVSNLYLCQALANIYQAEVIAGLDAQDKESGKNYNAAFHLKPMEGTAFSGCFCIKRYEKQVLLPLAEYLPLEIFRPLTSYYGITDFFSCGEESSVFWGRVPLSISICYEETFPEILRQGRQKGAALFVNVSNDNYYPNSQLSQQHFDHARLRTIENGIPLIRACNTGITAVIDRFGRTLSMLGEGGKNSEGLKGALVFPIIINAHQTFYTFWGDAGIIAWMVMFVLVFCRLKFIFRW